MRVFGVGLLFVLASMVALRGEQARAAPGDELHVTWQGVAAKLLRGVEPQEPFVRMFLDVPPENRKWQFYTGEVGERSTLRYETRRWLHQPTWSADGLRIGVGYNTYATSRDYVYDVCNSCMIGGVLSFDSGNGNTVPADLAITFPFLSFDVLPGGTKALLLEMPMFLPPLPTFQPPPLLMADAERTTAFTPIGLPGRVTPGAAQSSWSTDGAYVLLHSTTAPYFNPPGTPRPPSSLYTVSTADGAARLMMTERPGEPAQTAAVWSPGAENLVAFTQYGALWVLDPRTGSRRLTPDNTFGYVDRPTWHDSHRVWIGSKLIDVLTGQITTYDLGQNAAGVTPSPDGRYAVTFDFPAREGSGQEMPCPASKLPQNKLALFDLTTGASSPFKGCDGRSFISFQWMGDSRHVVMSGADIYCCHGGRRLLVLKDAVTGAETSLTRGHESGAAPVVSPDGTKVLITGDKLRVYAQTGDLLQETEPPIGFSVTSAAWAPDSLRFSFIVGPVGVEGP